VELTEAGRALAPGAKDGFETLGAAWRAARRVNDHASLTVTAGPAFTAIWLAPNLYSFVQAHPETELRLSASLNLVDLSRDEVDVAIRFGYGPDPDSVHVEPLLDDWMTPVMVPELARAFAEPEALEHAPLIHQDDIRFLDPPVDWPAWFRAQGLPERDWSGQRFSHADHAINAALSGAGVLLGRISFCSRYIREGRLVAPFRRGIHTGAGYRMLCLMGADSRPHIRAFTDWLKALLAPISEHGRDHDLIPAHDVPKTW
jgi:LysR family glycine cleavage system transcriptional activator